jgi:hypothetical protein
MIPGLLPCLAIGAEEHLESGWDDEFPVAINQRQTVANLLFERTLISNGLLGEPVAFPVYVPVAGNPAPSTSKKNDFQ